MNRLRDAIVRGARAGPRPGSGARGARTGDGFVFDRLRAYVEGDDPRRIDHAATARSGALQTRLYHEETSLVLAALLDESGSMRVGRTRAPLDAGREALQHWFAAAEGSDAVARILERRVLRDRRAARLAHASAVIPLAESLEVALATLPRGASLLLVTDGFEPLDDALLLRCSRRFDATALLVSDPWQAGLALRGVVHLRDAETGRTRRSFIGERARARYHRASVERSRALHARFHASGWRAGPLRAQDGRGALMRAFGLPP